MAQALALIALFFTALFGWVLNIVTIFTSFDFMSGGEAVVRIAGVIIPIIGAVVGWF